MRDSAWIRLGWIALAIGFGRPGVAEQPFEAVDVVDQLVAAGPRPTGSQGASAARRVLISAMSAVGLEEVAEEEVAGGRIWSHLHGVLPGDSGREIVLSAHYDTTEASRGAWDNASGCATVLGAASTLAEVPRRHALRVVLTDGEEDRAAGSRDWLQVIPAETRQRFLVDLDLDMVGSEKPGAGITHILVGYGPNGRVMTPAWLLEALLLASRTADHPLVVQDRKWSWWAQLAVRCARPTRYSDGRRFLESGVAAVTLSDLSLTDRRLAVPTEPGVNGERLRSWIRFTGAAALELDRIPVPPPVDSEYLVMGGRVWPRRQLVWTGFLLWVLLVWRGLPGRWRRRSPDERRDQGRTYLPGFAFRMLFLLAVFLTPVFTTLLLFPAGALGLLGRQASARRSEIICIAAVLPALGFVAWLAAGQIVGWFVLERAALLPAMLVAATLATFCVWQRAI